MKELYFNLLLSIQTSIPSIDGIKFEEGDKTIDLILWCPSLFRDILILDGIVLGIFVSLLVSHVAKHIAEFIFRRRCRNMVHEVSPLLMLQRNQLADIVAEGFGESFIRKLKQIAGNAKMKDFPVISIMFFFHGLRDFCIIRKMICLDGGIIYGYGESKDFTYYIVISSPCQHPHRINTNMEMPINRQISCVSEKTLIYEEEQLVKKTDFKHFILLVMSNKTLSDSLKESLSEWFECSVLEDSDQLQNVLTLSKPQVIILDETINGVSGEELCSRIKADKATANIPVVLMVKRTDDERCMSYIKSGVDRLEVGEINIGLLKTDIRMLIESNSAMQKRADQFIKRSITTSLPSLTTGEDEIQEFMNKLHEQLDAHLSNGKYTVKELSDKFSMSRTKFYNKVKNITQHSPKQYILIYKIEKAKILLASGHYTITDITYMLGFCDSKYFGRQFKKICGVCPSEYISNVIKGNVES